MIAKETAQEQRKKTELPELNEGLVQTLDHLDERLENFNLGSALEKFKTGCRKVRGIYESGGKLGQYRFEKCDLFDHDWHHLETDIVVVAKILPAFLEKNKNKEYSQEDVINILYATLLHDIGWLRTTSDPSFYKWGGEKFFIHCQDSSQKALSLLDELLLEVKEDRERKKKISELIRVTEFNKMDEDEPDLEEKDKTLGEVLYFADNFLSYFCDPDNIPVRVQGLYKEGQAIAREACDRTKKFFNLNKATIARDLGLTLTEIETRFEQGRLTMADLRFPGQSVVEFVGSNYLPNLREDCEEWLKYIDDWYSKGVDNKERVIYDQNIERVKAIQVLANTYSEEKGEEIIISFPNTNPYCFIEAAETGGELREVAIHFGLSKAIDDNDPWDAADLRMLGVSEKDLFERLLTRDIRWILGQLVESEKKKEALAYIIELFAKKNLLKRKAGKKRKDDIWLAIAPRAYAEKLDDGYENLMTAREVFEAFQLANRNLSSAENNENIPRIEPVWTVRREKDISIDNCESYADEIIELHQDGLLSKVVFAGKENTAWQEFYGKFIKKLTDANIEVTILAGQVMEGEGDIDMAVGNIKQAVELALNTDNKLVGLQAGLSMESIPEDLLKNLRTLGKNGQLIFTPSSDMEIKDRLLVKIKDLADHPMFKLIQAGIPVCVADPHSFFPTSVEIEAVRIVTAMFEQQVKSGEKKWSDFSFRDYVTEAKKFLMPIQAAEYQLPTSGV